MLNAPPLGDGLLDGLIDVVGGEQVAHEMSLGTIVSSPQGSHTIPGDTHSGRSTALEITIV